MLSPACFHRSRLSFACALAALLLMVGCGPQERPVDPPAEDVQPADAPLSAVAHFAPTPGNEVTGVVTFSALNGAVRVSAELSGLPPGRFGFHVHETGDCSAPHEGSAGGHFDPYGHRHGGPDDTQRHVGDLGNVVAGEDGEATYSRDDTILSLVGPNSIIDKAVIVHEGEDDLVTQPSGDAGDPAACGVIRLVVE